MGLAHDWHFCASSCTSTPTPPDAEEFELPILGEGAGHEAREARGGMVTWTGNAGDLEWTLLLHHAPSVCQINAFPTDLADVQPQPPQFVTVRVLVVDWGIGLGIEQMVRTVLPGDCCCR